MAGKVLVDGKVCDKPGTLVSEASRIEILEPENPFVSRGGLKLAGALEAMDFDVHGLTVLDVGASTGGFTDCLLKNGAGFIYALDVGYGQLDYSLRSDSRVTVMERCNIRHLTPEDLPTIPDLATVDVSFISLKMVVTVIERLKISALLALVKPQFEAGRNDASKGEGVIRDPELHKDILAGLINFSCEHGYCFNQIAASGYPGPKGNLEFFIYFTRKEEAICRCRKPVFPVIESAVNYAHKEVLKNQ